MDGRQPLAIAYGVTACAPESEREFDRWYREVHFKDALEAGVYANPVMFHYPSTPVPDDEGRFLATYEIYDADLRRVVERFASFIPRLQRDYDAMGGKRVFGGFFQVVHRLFSEQASGLTNSLLAIRVDCNDSDVELVELWYRDVCIPQSIESPVFHTASLNRWSENQPAPGWDRRCRFLALFESAEQSTDLMSALEQSVRHSVPAPDHTTKANTYLRAGATPSVPSS